MRPTIGQRLFGIALGLILAVIATFVIAFFNGDVQAQGAGICPDRATVERILSGQYRETRHGGGISNHGTVIEFWHNEETGTWTVTETSPDGLACIRSFGETWEAITEELPPPGDPA